jgi:thioredoxin-dependent peroxiredoxin
MVEVGHPAPEAAFATMNGTRKAIADYRGKALVLYFYPKDDTPGCTKEAQEFSALAADFAAADVALVGISKDTVASHGKFAVKHDLRIELGSDVDGTLCEAFGTWVEKSMYGRSYLGIERATFLIGADGTIRQIWRKVKVAGHAAAVLAAAKTLR